MKHLVFFTCGVAIVGRQTESGDSRTEQCQAWCQSYLSCRRDQAGLDLEGRELMAECAYVDPAAALAECVRQCPTLVIRDVAPSEECLDCGAQAADVCTTQKSCAEVCPDPRGSIV